MELTDELTEEIKYLKKKTNAIILAHVYQRGEVQEIADYVGDSLDLSRKALNTSADIIVFCGVKFMAETAAILNHNKTILLPDNNAGCGLADLATVEKLREIKSNYPDSIVVSYINSSAAIKAESDICCTSANAVSVVSSLPDDQILFVPDRNLGSYVAEQTNKDIILWDGSCYVHENITTDQLVLLKAKHINAEIIVHPECPVTVRHMANFIGGTSHMSRYVSQSDKSEFIVGTEVNFIYRLRKDNPNKKFYPVNSRCEGMNEITLEKVRNAMDRMEFLVSVPDRVRDQAKVALDRMLYIY